MGLSFHLLEIPPRPRNGPARRGESLYRLVRVSVLDGTKRLLFAAKVVLGSVEISCTLLPMLQLNLLSYSKMAKYQERNDGCRLHLVSEGQCSNVSMGWSNGNSRHFLGPALALQYSSVGRDLPRLSRTMVAKGSPSTHARRRVGVLAPLAWGHEVVPQRGKAFMFVGEDAK